MDLFEDIESRFASGQELCLDLATLLEKNKRPGAKLSPDKYKIQPVISEYQNFLFSQRYSYEVSKNVEIQISMSAKYGLMLLYEDFPSAMLTFDAGDTSDNSIKIHDLICIIPIECKRINPGDIRVYKRGIPKGLGSIFWTDLFYDYLFDLMLSYNLKTVEQNTALEVMARVLEDYRGSFEDSEQVRPLTYGEAVRRYDRTAQKQGFMLVNMTTGKKNRDVFLEKKLSMWEKAGYDPLLVKPYSLDSIWVKSISLLP